MPAKICNNAVDDVAKGSFTSVKLTNKIPLFSFFLYTHEMNSTLKPQSLLKQTTNFATSFLIFGKEKYDIS